MASAEGGISAFERRILVPDEYVDIAKEALKALDAPADPDLLAEGDWDDDPA
jgi:hypothetical protein